MCGMLLTTRRLENISRWATSPVTMDIPMASMDIKYEAHPADHTVALVAATGVW